MEHNYVQAKRIRPAMMLHHENQCQIGYHETRDDVAPSPDVVYRPTLSKAQRGIVEKIKDLYRRQQPLNITAVKRDHPALMEAVYKIKPFWGWKQALEAAGIDYTKINVRLSEYVTCQICGREMRHLCSHLPRVHDISAEEYRMDFPSAEILSESTLVLQCKLGRSQQHGPRPWEPVWSPEYSLDLLANLHRSGVQVHMAAVREMNEMLRIHCVKYFGSYDEALRRIGLDPAKIRQRTGESAPSKQAVIDQIQKRQAQGKSLSRARTLAESGWMPGFASAIYRHFGNWRNALEAAGFKDACKGLRKFGTKQDVLRAIRKRKQENRPLNSVGLMRGLNKDPALYKNGARLFGSWQKAIRASRLNFKAISMQRLKYPNKQSIIQEIRRRDQVGLILTSRRGHGSDQTLIRAIYKFYGSFPLAMKAAGVSKKARRRSK